MEQDSWGDCLLVDDGEPIPDVEDDIYEEGDGDGQDEDPEDASE